MKQLTLFRGHVLEMEATLNQRKVADALAGKIRKRQGLNVICTGVRRCDGVKVWRITENP